MNGKSRLFCMACGCKCGQKDTRFRMTLIDPGVATQNGELVGYLCEEHGQLALQVFASNLRRVRVARRDS